MKKLRRSNLRAARNSHRRPAVGNGERAPIAKRGTCVNIEGIQRLVDETLRHEIDNEIAPIMAKRETKTQYDVEFEDELKRSREWGAVLTNDFSDSEDPDPKPMGALEGRANRDIEELARQIHCCCSDKKWTSYQKRVACEQLVKLASLATTNVHRLAREFPAPFREIAEELPWFPCLFPAHVEQLRYLQKIMWDEFNLGKRHPLKLRAAPGRKTFSTKTWANCLLNVLIPVVHKLAREEEERDPGEKYESTFRDVAYRVSLTPQNAKKWLDVMWKVLLVVIPNPETHPRLRQLVERPSLRTKRMRRDGTVGEKTQAHNMRADIKRKLGVYLRRMLNDSAVHK
jgi:hypothetical protein